jgi:GDP-L-fucose synthase
MLLVQAQAYREQYGFNAIYLLPVNLYGPRDNFNLETSHVIPALIRKCLEAQDRGDKQVVLWGDGSPTREFLYVEDAAEGILLAAERYNGSEPVNLGSAWKSALKTWPTLISRLTGFEGELVWDTTKPNGQPRRVLDTSRAEQYFGFRAQVPLKKACAAPSSGTGSTAAARASSLIMAQTSFPPKSWLHPSSCVLRVDWALLI